MKILLDENIDVRFKFCFPAEYEVYTVRDMGWNGIKNGLLLLLLADNNFHYWIVVDKNIPYQQNINTIPCPVIILDVYRNTLKHIEMLLPKIIKLLEDGVSEKIIVIK